MNILELDSYNLADTVKFHDRLNPRLWDDSEHIRPEVHAKLMEIARDFQEFLGVPDLDVKDVTVSGSNAAYNYTPQSDIDLHLVIDLPEADRSEVYRELFDAKKFQYNSIHNIRIGGYDVELYVQNPNQEHHSQGIYSLLNNNWISVPRRRKAEIDDISTRSKYEDLAARIDNTVSSGSHDDMNALMKKIKAMRQVGLEQHGELGSDNLAFKLLRNNGYIKKLIDAKNAARDHELSLAEKAKPKQHVTYGFAKESPDGVNPSTKSILEEPMSESPDGVNPSTAMFLTEADKENVVREFIDFVADRLGIDSMPEIELHTDPNWSRENKSFGRYTPETHTLEVNLANRHIMDILRTTAHELVHCRQNQQKALPHNAGDTGSHWENQAHAIAGVIMRDYADSNPAMFENASGYIPKNKREARDPRYSMAVSVDIKPGQIGKEANKLALKTDSQGKPGLLIKSANLRESRMPQPSQGPGKYRDLNEPLGPEFKPTMPKGTVRVDVSDVYDWYKLGKHIPNLDRADPGEFGKGPPSTIVSFGDEDTEHKYIDHLKKLGLSTTDIDPVDPNQPPGMPRQKTDPTYNVDENELAESLRQELQVFEDQDLMEIKMTSKNLAQLAKAIPGVMVGLEFEMIVPNTDSPSNDDMEPDYDQDERVRDIDDAVNFFDDGDYNGRNEIRRLRESMESDYQDWVMEQIDEDWFGGNGMEFFQEFLDREYPFDRDDAFEEARDEIMTANPDLPQDSEELQQLISARVDEMEASYYVDQWEEQGRYYDYAREEFEDEQRDSLSELDWLSNQGIRFASDVHTQYPVVSWPYWTSPGGDETDAKEVALNFMNFMGYDTIAVGDYHGYGGGYELWNGDRWVKIGSNKPMDAFTVEPDGSLTGDDAGDAGLEFVSPPIPLAQIGDTMAKVQAWAAQNGVYTGKGNGTALHTNVSIPDYSIDKLDYLKAALLLGDEHVLRDFDRITNTYAKPAIAKVKELVRNKPEKAEELLNKMKSQLNAEASKLIHSGTTDKYTSINTKDNRIEFRSPGGDYLSIIADNPQKMIDTINRMVVAMDAAMDPNKYKEEYQKKLYKLLTGQTFGRETQTGAKQEMKQDDKDLLNIFSRYAAGELPKQALKSFVRQAQLQRSVAKGKAGGKMWWKVSNPAHSFASVEVVASTKEEAIKQALGPDGYPSWANTRNTVVAEPLRPYEEKPQKQGTTVAGRPNNPEGNWYLKNADTDEIFYRFNAANYQDAHTVLQQWKQENPDSNINAVYGQGRAEPAQSAGDQAAIWYVSIIGRPGSEIQVRASSAGEAEGQAQTIRPDIFGSEEGNIRASTVPVSQAASQQTRTGINYEIFRGMDRDDVVAAFVAADDQAAMERLARYRETHPGAEYNADLAPMPGSTIDLQRQRAAQAQEIPEVPLDIEIAQPSEYELYRISDGRAVTAPAGNPIVFRANSPEDAESKIARYAADFNLGAPELFAVRSVLRPVQQDNWSQDFERRMQAGSTDQQQGGIVDVAGEQPTQGTFTGEWKVIVDGEEVYRFSGVGNSQADANRVGRDWVLQQIRQRTLNPGDGADIEILPVMR